MTDGTWAMTWLKSMASHPVAALPKHALDIREAAQAVADFVPIDFVFRSSRVCTLVERFDRRGTEPFELFRSEFGQNSWNP